MGSGEEREEASEASRASTLPTLKSFWHLFAWQLEVYRARFEEFPSDFETALAYAEHLASVGETEEALKVLDHLQTAGEDKPCFFPQDPRERRDPRLVTDPRPDLLRVQILQGRGEFRELEEYARKAAVKAAEAGSRREEGQALIALSAALQMLGDP